MARLVVNIEAQRQSMTNRHLLTAAMILALLGMLGGYIFFTAKMISEVHDSRTRLENILSSHPEDHACRGTIIISGSGVHLVVYD